MTDGPAWAPNGAIGRPPVLILLGVVVVCSSHSRFAAERRNVAHRRAAVGALLLACVAAPSARAQCTDVTPPKLSPLRGEMLEQGGTADDTVLVSGLAFDAASPLISLVIDGQEQLSAQATDPVPSRPPRPVPGASRS